MGHSQADKARSRERILRKAADAVRDTGLESVSVGKLMRSVDLTHGGFYNHFESRSDLLAQALERALLEGARTAAASTSTHSATQFSPTTSRRSPGRRPRPSRWDCAVVAAASSWA